MAHLMNYFRPQLKFQVIFLALALLTLTSCELPFGLEWGSIGYNQGYQPDQPIPYSHELHAGNYQIPCLYCHSTAERANHAAVPSLNICMNCHIVIPGDKHKDAIEKIKTAFTNNEPIAWVKVHMLPDFVKFNHKRHVQRFGTPESCHKCHGPIETMAKVYQHSSLSMGWCVNCHRQPENNAPVSCSTCHY